MKTAAPAGYRWSHLIRILSRNIHMCVGEDGWVSWELTRRYGSRRSMSPIDFEGLLWIKWHQHPRSIISSHWKVLPLQCRPKLWLCAWWCDRAWHVTPMCHRKSPSTHGFRMTIGMAGPSPRQPITIVVAMTTAVAMTTSAAAVRWWRISENHWVWRGGCLSSDFRATQTTSYLTGLIESII